MISPCRIIQQENNSSEAKLMRVLGREGEDSWTLCQIYLAMVESVLFYGSETWVMTSLIGRVLGIFHHRVARRLTGCQPYMGITRSTLPQNNGNPPLPFLGGNYPFFYWIIFIHDYICILTCSPGWYLLINLYVIQESGGSKNSPDSLNVMVNHHYHDENRIISW